MPPAAAAAVVPAQRKGSWAGLLIVAVLLAIAAGLGTAALVKNRPATWRATSVVVLTPGEAPSVNPSDALRLGQDRYRLKVSNSSFTAIAALRIGMPDTEVRTLVKAQPDGGSQLLLVANTSSGKGAIALANAAALTLADTVKSDQVLASSSVGDRLGAAVQTPSMRAERTSPTDRSIALYGALAALAVLLIVALGATVSRSKNL